MHANRRRRGSIYFIVLSMAMVVTVIGLAGVTLNRLGARDAAQFNDGAEARLLAFSAAEHAFARIDAAADWRAALADVTVEQPFGRGAYRWQIVDETDGLLADDASDPATIVATGSVGAASYTLRVRLEEFARPKDALGNALTAGAAVEVTRGDSLTVEGRPLWCNDVVNNKGTIYGDLGAKALEGNGTVTGDVVTPVPPLAIPAWQVLDTFKDKATVIDPAGTIRKVVLSPGSNPWGPPNPDGVYYINAGSSTVMLRGVRLHGTLVVECGTLVLDNAVFMRNYRRDHPVLVVNGNVRLTMSSAAKGLDESEWGANFNPPGSDYEGSADGDQTDSYPNEVQGLVHVTGDLVMQDTSVVRGIVVCGGQVTVSGTNKVIYDPAISRNPPQGYAAGSTTLRCGTWTRQVQ